MPSLSKQHLPLNLVSTSKKGKFLSHNSVSLFYLGRLLAISTWHPSISWLKFLSRQVLLRSTKYLKRVLSYCTTFHCLEHAPIKQWQEVRKSLILKGRVSISIVCFWRIRQLQINMRPKAETLALKCNLTNKRQHSCVGLGFSCFVSDTHKIRKFLILWMEVRLPPSRTYIQPKPCQ